MSRRPVPLLRLRVAAALYWFRESLFLLPAIVVHAGVALAEVCAAVDRAAGPGSVVPLTLDINSNAATWLLSTVAGATITTAGVVVLTVGTVVLIIAHLARGLQVGELARGIAQEGEELIAAMLSRPATRSPRPGRYRRSDGEGFEVATARDGWVTQAAADRMLAAVPPGSTVRLETRSGAYIHEKEPLVTVWPAPGNPDEVRNHPSATVMVLACRAMQQDVDFALRQLVDIGLRALSSAVNDPTTAVEVTLRVAACSASCWRSTCHPRPWPPGRRDGSCSARGSSRTPSTSLTASTSCARPRRPSCRSSPRCCASCGCWSITSRGSGAPSTSRPCAGSCSSCSSRSPPPRACIPAISSGSG